MVTGIQNAEGSTLMTLADMSVITAEVKVDETDIVNVQLNQTADVTVDALPGKVFKGHVTEVGDQALLRTTGVATSQSTTGTEEAKDFKVIVTLDGLSDSDGQLNDELRPGPLGHRQDHHRTPSERHRHPHPGARPARSGRWKRHLPATPGTPSASSLTTAPAPGAPKPVLVQGVYLLKPDHSKKRAVFVPVTTGVTGATDIEVLTGVAPGDTLVTGRYKVLRTLKSGTAVKPDNSADTSNPPQLDLLTAAPDGHDYGPAAAELDPA